MLFNAKEGSRSQQWECWQTTQTGDEFQVDFPGSEGGQHQLSLARKNMDEHYQVVTNLKVEQCHGAILGGRSATCSFE